MTYTDFVKTNKEIIDGFQQDGFSWRNSYDTSFLEMVSSANEDFRTAIDNLPESLDRDTVRSCFHSDIDLYKGFVSCMLWGGINATRCAKGHKGDRKTTDAYKAFTHPKSDVVKKLKSVKKYLDDGSVEKAFLSLMYPQKNHLPGIGVSFFTKLLYFISPIEVSPTPLIYDKWSSYIHCALLIDEQEDDVLNYYKGVNKDRTLSMRKKQIELYMDYLRLMKETAKENGIDDVSKLEAYLFGFARNGAGHKEEKHRRDILEEYVLNYFKSNNRSEEDPSKPTPLSNGQSLRENRHVLFGYRVPFEGRNYYLFVGKKSFNYLELLTDKKSERIEDCRLFHELENEGFNNNGKDYMYKRLEPYDESDAKLRLESIIIRMTNHKKG